MTKPLGVVLAGGRSSRMGGGDKSLLMLGGKPLLAHVIDRLSPQTAKVIISANGDISRFAKFGCPVVTDSVEGFAGPLAGVLAGMDYAAENGFERIVTAATDTPFFPSEMVGRLELACTAVGKQIGMAVSPDPERGVSRHPTFSLWQVALRDELRKALHNGVRKMMMWADEHGCATASFETHPFDPFFNVNTPDDMARAKTMLAEACH